MTKDSIFTDNYTRLRKQEGRLYTDAEVLHLPAIHPSHIHYQEWQTRKKSAQRLLHYLQRKKRPLSILEVGSGNGWLSALLSTINGSFVTASEINSTELQQAKRIFGDRKNIEFVQEDIRDVFFDDKKFDIIIFAASVQYFPSFTGIINRARFLLNENGEIHIIDSFFYKENEREQAISSTKKYYSASGFAAMSEFYFHHTSQSLKEYNHQFLFNPAGLLNKLFNNTSRFPWVCIRNK